MIIGIDASRAYIASRTGTENYSYHLINQILRLPEAKLHVFVLFTRPNAFLPKELDGYSNVIVKEVKWKYLWTQGGLALETWREQVFQYSGDPVLQRKITGKPENRNTGTRKLDVLWIPAHTLPVLRNPKIKTVVTIHGLEYQWLKEYKNLLQRWYLPLSTIYAAKYADKIIAVSQFTKSELIKELQNRSNRPKADPPWTGKIKVIHEGTMFSGIPVIQSSSNTYQKFGIEQKKYVLFVGSVQPRKNLVALIETFARFASDNVSDYKLVIAGGTGWMADEVFRAPNKYGISDKVVFTGRVGDMVLRELYLGASVYVQPSITEGFGLPVLEAMSCGVVVISSDGGALSEVVGEAGIIVALKTDFVKKLAEAMKRVISDHKLQKKLISMGHKRVGELSWEKAGRETLKVIAG